MSEGEEQEDAAASSEPLSRPLIDRSFPRIVQDCHSPFPSSSHVLGLRFHTSDTSQGSRGPVKICGSTTDYIIYGLAV